MAHGADTSPNYGTNRREIALRFFPRPCGLRCSFRRALHLLQQDHSMHISVSSRWWNTGSSRYVPVPILFINKRPVAATMGPTTAAVAAVMRLYADALLLPLVLGRVSGQCLVSALIYSHSFPPL
jgi:hypothetical protein